MSAVARRAAILRAAGGVIARAGINGASVREIASAAGVSEALLYKHFPSKAAIYDEALAMARGSSQFTISRFATLPPNTESFVLLAYATIEFIMFGFPGRGEEQYGTWRLMFQSLLDDGVHARHIMSDTAAAWKEHVVANYAAAVAAGDIVELAIEPANRFRFVQQLGVALRLSHLPDSPALEYEGTKRDLADQAVLFTLRGLGLRDEAIARYFDPDRLQARLAELFPREDS